MKEKYAFVLGLGISGQGAVKLLSSLGYRVMGFDARFREKNLEGIPLFSDQTSLPDLPWRFGVISPGLSPKHPLCTQAVKKGVPLIGEIDLALKLLSQTCIGITGTNGKTTLTHLFTSFLRLGGLKARALGNIGESLCLYAMDPDPSEILVIELSSFQIERLETKAFFCGVITSLSPDHLDRHRSFAEYARTKCHLADLLVPEGKFFIAQDAMEVCSPFLEGKIEPQKIEKVSTQLAQREENLEKRALLQLSFIEGMAKHCGLSQEKIDRICASLSPSFFCLEHRIEHVATLDGIAFYNDSKATNVAATLFALEVLEEPIVLIVGGSDKGADFSSWKTAFPKKVKKVMTIGDTAPKIERCLDGCVPLVSCETLDRAVEESFACSVSGDRVVLSPGCASFDQFLDYRDRGVHFKNLVNRFGRR